jgi:ATP-dependent Lon protease
MLFHYKKDNRDAASNETVALLPLREMVVFPHEVNAILVGRQKSIKALEAAESGKRPILLAVQKDARVSEPGPDDIYAVGTLGVVVQLLRLPDGTVKALLEGKTRARIVRYASQDEFFQVEVEEIEEVCERTTEVEALMRVVQSGGAQLADSSTKTNRNAQHRFRRLCRGSAARPFSRGLLAAVKKSTRATDNAPLDR